MVSDDFQDHLAMEHRSGRGSLHVYEAELPGNMHRAQRRLATSSRRGNRQRHYTPSTTSSMANSQSAILRESMDPIAGMYTSNSISRLDSFKGILIYCVVHLEWIVKDIYEIYPKLNSFMTFLAKFFCI